MFGADGNGATKSGLLNDWWKYNASTNQWTWVSGSNEPGATSVYGSLGVFASSNQPGSRKDVIGWSDATGNLWMFGGYGPDVSGNSGYLNDLWKFTQ
jgi:N-acetylneuraminic acid mutarotase